MGHLESYYFLPKETAREMELKEEEKPHLRDIDPEVGVWHTVKLTMKGRTFSAEYDGEVLYDNFQFHDWMMNMEPAPIRLQKHIVVHGDNLGDENPVRSSTATSSSKNLGRETPPSRLSLRKSRGEGGQTPRDGLTQCTNSWPGSTPDDLPEGYEPTKHQEYVDRRMAKLSDEQRGRSANSGRRNRGSIRTCPTGASPS